MRASVVATAGVLLAGAALAQTPAEPVEPPAPPAAPVKPLWEAGVVGLALSQQAYPGSDQQVGRVLALPYVLYRGPLLRADQGTVGLRAAKTQRYELDIGFAAALGSQAGDIEARRGMDDLGTLVEAGPRIKWFFGPSGQPGRWRLEVPLRGVFDLDEGLAWRGWALAPRLVFEHRVHGWSHEISGGPLIGSRRLNEMYYGVPAAQATPQRPAYRADGGLMAWRLQTWWGRPIDSHWYLFAFARLDSVAGAANAGSPLVRRRNGGSVGVGMSWSGWRSQRPAVD